MITSNSILEEMNNVGNSMNDRVLHYLRNKAGPDGMSVAVLKNRFVSARKNEADVAKELARALEELQETGEVHASQTFYKGRAITKFKAAGK